MTPAQRSEAIRKAEKSVQQIQDLPWDEVDAAILKEWRAAGDKETRDDLWHDLRALGRVKSRLYSHIQNAQVAVMEINAEQAKQEDPYARA